MFDLIFLLFTYFTEALIVFTYVKRIYEPKKSNVKSFLLILAIYFILFIIYRFIINNEIINILLVVLANIISIYFLYKSSFKSSIFHSIILCILQLVAEFLTAYFTSIVFSSSFQNSINNHFESGVILSRILYFLFCSFLSKLSLKETDAKSWGKWCALSLLPISSIIVITVLKVITDAIPLTLTQNIATIVSISFLLLTNIIIYIIYEYAEKSNQKLIELELVNQKNDIDMQYLNLIEKKNETMNIMAHDYKNHVMTISNMSNLSEIKEYINNMLGEITKYNQIGKTKNKLLDVILGKYLDICKEKEIKFETDIMSDNLKFINNYDISALFNNLLDNAVEAAAESHKKFVHLEITNSLNSYHKITVTNSSDNEPKSKNGKLITTKNNKETHGFGTKSIRKIVKKYNGELQWEYDKKEKQFKLIILFPENKI